MEKSISPWYNKEMSYYHAGTTIKETRERKKIAQEDLCYGLCSVATLSKIENGRQNPNRKLLEALTQRLGIPLGLYNIPITQVEYRRYQIEYEVRDLVVKGVSSVKTQLKKLLQEYNEMENELDALEKQFLLFHEGLVLESDGLLKKAQEQFICAIKNSIPDFDYNNISEHRLLTNMEISILMNLSRIDNFSKQSERAEKTMYFLKNYFESHQVDPEQYAKLMPCILFNLANYEEDNKDFEQELRLAEQGIEICIKCNKLAYLNFLLAQKGIALLNLGEREEAKDMFVQAFTLSKIAHCETYDKSLKDILRDEFGLKQLKNIIIV